MNFIKIGFGEITTTKKGKKAIVLRLDPSAKDAMYKEDFESKIWIFKNNEGSRIPYTVMAPMPDDYEFPDIRKKISE